MKNPYQKYYSDSYNSEETIKLNTKYALGIRAILKKIKFSSKKRVLDVACGIGTLGKTFTDNPYGFDINLEAVKAAKKNGVRAIHGDVERKWPYPEEFFDFVVASHIIEHVVNPDNFLFEVKRVLKKNGLLIIITPNLAAWFNRILLLFGIQPFFTEVSTIDKTLGLKFTRKLTQNKNPVGHLRIFTPNSLRELLELHELKVLNLYGSEFGSFPRMLQVIDSFLSNISSLASTIIIVGRK